MFPRLLTCTLYVLLISTVVQTRSPLRPALNYLKGVALEKIMNYQSEGKFLAESDKERSFPYLSTILSIVDTISTDTEPEQQETVEKNEEEKAIVTIPKVLDADNKIELSENVENPEQKPQVYEGQSDTGAEILHILVMIVIVLAGIGAVVAIIAFIAFLINYCKRRVNVIEGKRPGTEDLLLLDNSHMPTRGSV